MKTRDCIKWLWKASYGCRKHIVASSLTGMLHVTASMSFVWICKKLIDNVTSGSGESLTPDIIFLASCMLMQVILSAIEQHILNKSDIVMKNRLRYRLFTQMMESRWNGKETFHTGDALNRVMEDVRVVSESVTRSVPAVLTAGVQFIAAFIFLFSLAPGLAWTIPGIMLVMLVISKSYIRRMRRLTKDIRTTESDMQSLMQESLQHRLVLHTLESTPYVSDALTDRQENLKDKVMDKTGYTIFTRSLIQIGFSAGYAVAFLWGVFGIKGGTATFGMMTAFLQLVGQIQRPVMNLSRQISPLINSITSAERLSEMEEQPTEEHGDPHNLGTNVGIRFDNVEYSYPDGNGQVLKGFTYDFKPGSTTAIVGETGAGKSTIMRLMLALLTPDKGHVTIYNNKEEREVSPQTRCNIIYVPQGNTLMSGTIRENLLLGDPEADEKRLRETLHLAAADFVEDLPEGLDTMCGERGAGLSEGQAQRIAIARSLLRKGSLLLLDEPTSALDAQTEETLIRRLSASLDGRTMIIVTHREAALALCQNVLGVDMTPDPSISSPSYHTAN